MNHLATRRRLLGTCLSLLLLCFSSKPSFASEHPLKLAVPFTSNMVLQRQKEIPVWGFAKPLSQITVRFADQTVTTNADPKGDWRLHLEAIEASKTGRELSVTSDEQEIILSNVLVGEVWFSSGQSNMVWLANSSMCRDLATQLTRSETDIPIREISIDTVSALYPQKHARSADGWKTHKQAGTFSALSLSFAYDLYKELDVPIGILLSAHSNTRIEAFTQRKAIETHAELKGDRTLIVTADPLTKAGQEAYDNYYEELLKWQAEATHAISVETRLPTRPALPGIAGMWRGPSQFFNGKINPVIPFAIRGAIWCQGTSNSGDGRIYASRMEALVNGWREAWDMPQMPFIFTQMQCYGTPDANNVGFADVRQAQHLFFVNNRHNVGMVVQSDLNSARPQGIHYFNKLHPGMRMARWALAKTYGKDIAYTGPIYAGYKVLDNQVLVSFEEESLFGGLMIGSKGMAKNYGTPGHYVEPAQPTPAATLNHFRLCGNDKVWHPAIAEIRGNSVVVISSHVENPIGVQYAYSGTPENSNLYNKAGLPATPFAVINNRFIFEEDDPVKVAALKARYARFTDPDYPILQVVEYFRDGAIIQRGKPIPVWGHANRGVEVAVTLGGITKTTVANDYQQWSLEFPPLRSSTTPITLTVDASHGHQRTVTNILVGDVWYLTGSTNLTSEMSFNPRNQDAALPHALPLVREFRRKTSASTFTTPRKRKFETGGGRYRSSWLSADMSPNHEGVSMFAYHFAHTLDRKGIPQGFITMSSGQSKQMASPLSWTSYAGVKDVANPAFKERLKQLFLQYPDTDIAQQALTTHINEVKQYVNAIVSRPFHSLDYTDGVPLAAPTFPEAGTGDHTPIDTIPTYAYNWSVSPMTPMAVAGVVWVPSQQNIGYTPEHYAAEVEYYHASLKDTYGLEKVLFLYAQPEQNLVDGISEPTIHGSKPVLFDQWPSSLENIAVEMANRVRQTKELP